MIREQMPIYDYRCDHCGHAFSAVQSFKDGPIEECPNCGKRPRKLLSNPALVFKGGGWYKTDSRPKEKESGDAAVVAKDGAKDVKEAKGTKETKETKDSPAPKAQGGGSAAGGETAKSDAKPKSGAASS